MDFFHKHLEKFILTAAIVSVIAFVNAQVLAYQLVKQPLNFVSLSFRYQSTKIVESKSEPEVSLIAVGDIMLSRVVAEKIKLHGPDYPFLEIKDLLNSADFAFANLESPLTPGREIKTGEMVFRADPALAKTLRDYNFQVLSLANNHLPNFGESGIQDTLENLRQNRILGVGAGLDGQEAYQAVLWAKNSLRIAFLAYNHYDVVPDSYVAGPNHAGTAIINQSKMEQAVKEAKQQVDLVIVSLHAGNEYTSQPNQSQISFARGAIDAGADLVIGHHPHWVQQLEKYQGKYIFYSLGNFIFDQMWSEETAEGLVIKINLTKDGVKKIELVPIVIEDYCQPQLADQEKSEKIIERLGYQLDNDSRLSLILE